MRLDRLDLAREPLPYFVTTVLHATVDVCRRERRERAGRREVERAEAARVEEDVSRRDAVDDLLAGVRPEEREVMTAHYLRGLSATEIAAERGVEVSQVYRQLHRGRSRVRKRFCAA
jgi:RNA polymerase sigma factor (sigma-70 family)